MIIISGDQIYIGVQIVLIWAMLFLQTRYVCYQTHHYLEIVVGVSRAPIRWRPPGVLMQWENPGATVVHPTPAGVHVLCRSTPDGACSHACLCIWMHLNVQCLAETKHHLIYCNKSTGGHCKQNSNLKVAVLTEHCMHQVSLAEN